MGWGVSIVMEKSRQILDIEPEVHQQAWGRARRPDSGDRS